MINYENVLQEFKKYISNYDLQNKEVALKVSHSYHVADLAKKLAKRMNLNEEDTCLVMSIGLLHDIGRFIQYQKKQSYSDIKTKLDHAQLADTYLFKEGHIKDFGIDQKYHDIIRKSIINHNKLRIASDLEAKEMFYAKFIRDIDKIDILRVNATQYEFSFKEAISPKVKEAFYKHILIDNLDIENKSDYIVSQIAFIYDINFKESYELLNDTDNLEFFLSIVDVAKEWESEFDKLKKEIRNYLEERMHD